MPSGVALPGTFILRLISGDSGLAVDATNGTEILDKANDLIEYNSICESLGVNVPGKPRSASCVSVYELVRDATYRQMFESLEVDLNRLCLTQGQIVAFAKKYGKNSRWFPYPGAEIPHNFFLFTRMDEAIEESCNNLFVAHVNQSPRSVHWSKRDIRLSKWALPFSHDVVWRERDVRRIVVPRLE